MVNSGESFMSYIVSDWLKIQLILIGVIEKLKTAFVEMPYEGEHGSISMFVLLPVFTPNAIDELLNNITPEILDEVLSSESFEEVTVEFPKISFERKFKLVPVSLM